MNIVLLPLRLGRHIYGRCQTVQCSIITFAQVHLPRGGMVCLTLCSVADEERQPCHCCIDPWDGAALESLCRVVRRRTTKRLDRSAPRSPSVHPTRSHSRLLRNLSVRCEQLANWRVDVHGATLNACSIRRHIACLLPLSPLVRCCTARSEDAHAWL